MLLAAEFGTGQVLWSIFWFFLFLLWISLVISIFADIIRSDDLSGVAKALWSIFVIFLPFLGVFIYLIVRGSKMKGHRRGVGSSASADLHRRYSPGYGPGYY